MNKQVFDKSEKALRIGSVSKSFYIGIHVCLKSNSFSTGIIIGKARKRQGKIYWQVEWDDGEIKKVRGETLYVC